MCSRQAESALRATDDEQHARLVSTSTAAQECDAQVKRRHLRLCHLNQVTSSSSSSSSLICKESTKKFARTRTSKRAKLLASILLAVHLTLNLNSRLVWGQFLFTYEINQESDDSRTPKSSLFDPNSYKIVTPSQLQSSYQRLATQAPEQAPSVPSSVSSSSSSSLSSGSRSQSTIEGESVTQQPSAPSSSSSFLKQTSAAIQSFAELFNFGPSSSPSPLGVGGSLTPRNAEPLPSAEQQAEARSLHEHWTTQQQKAHQQHLAPAFQSFTTAPSTPSAGQAALQASSQPSASRASYWLTSSSNPLSSGPNNNFLVEIKSTSNQAQQQQQATGNSQQHHASLVDSLLAIGQPQTMTQQANVEQAAQQQVHRSVHATVSQLHPKPAVQQHSSQTAVATNSLSPAQNSFLATPPTSYYPTASSSAAAVATQPIATQQQQQTSNQQAPNFEPQSQALHQHQARSLTRQTHQQFHPSTTTTTTSEHQLQPPANVPGEHHFSAPYAPTPSTPATSSYLSNFKQPTLSQQTGNHQLKSAEESLLAFRQQQQQQHDAQNALHAAQQQLVAAEQERRHQQNLDNIDTPTTPTHQELAHEQRDNVAVRQQQQRTYPTSDIPKISPQIYESFLLQQKDQFEKHMELLKQQQELNKLIEEKQKQQRDKQAIGDIEKRKPSNVLASRKKDELEQQELRKKSIARAEQEQQLQAARKARQEAEEARRKQQLKKQQEEEEERENNKRRALDEERRYKEYLEQLEKRKALERRQQQQQQQQLQLQRQREKELREQQELEQRRRREQQVAAEEALKKQLEYKNYLRIREEELRKLLELKQREDEAAAIRRRQVAAAQSTTPTTTTTTTTAASVATINSLSNSRIALKANNNNNRLAPIDFQKERTITASNKLATRGQQPNAASWGVRARVQPSASVERQQSGSSPVASSTTLVDDAPPPPPVSVTAPITYTSTARPAARVSSSSTRTTVGGRSLTKASDEKLIRQKIPLYSGAGKYGLYHKSSLPNDTTLADLVALLDSVTLPPAPPTTTTTATSSTTTVAPTTTTTTSAPYLSTNDEQHDNENQRAALANNRQDMSSSLSPLLNLRDIVGVTPSSFLPAPASSTIDPLSGTTVFDDDVPRRSSPPASGVINNQRVAPAAASSFSTSLRATSPRTLATASANTTNTGGSRTAHIGLASLPADSDADGIPGRAGIEYPVLSAVPPTSFSCSKQPLNGYYADTETACQVVHLCQGGVQSSILCPNGTIFNQEKFSCQWWYEVNCSRAPNFYQLNDNLYKSGTNLIAAELPTRTNSDNIDTAATPSSSLLVPLPHNKQAKTVIVRKKVVVRAQQASS